MENIGSFHWTDCIIVPCCNIRRPQTVAFGPGMANYIQTPLQIPERTRGWDLSMSSGCILCRINCAQASFEPLTEQRVVYFSQSLIHCQTPLLQSFWPCKMKLVLI